MEEGFKEGRLTDISKLKHCFYITYKTLAYNGVKIHMHFKIKPEA